MFICYKTDTKGLTNESAASGGKWKEGRT